MKTPIKHHLTNWSNGMKISGTHFVDSENALQDQIRDSLAISQFVHQYGLLNSTGNFPSLQLDVIDSHAKFLKIRLRSCRAITAEGVRIELSPETIEAFKGQNLHEAEVDISGLAINNFDVVLQINPFDRLVFGAPEGSEYPVRFKHCAGFFKLGIFPVGQINSADLGKFALVIGKINFIGDNGLLDANFIPACVAVSSYPALLDQYQKFAKILFECQKNAITIIQNVHGKKQNSDLAVNVRTTCEEVVRFVSDISFEYENKLSLCSPFDLVNIYMKLSRRIRGHFQMVNKREELVMYFTKWLELGQGNFENLITETSRFTYNHNDISDALRRIDLFLNNLNNLLNQLAQLDILEEKSNKGSFILSQKDIGGGGDSGYNMFAD